MVFYYFILLLFFFLKRYKIPRTFIVFNKFTNILFFACKLLNAKKEKRSSWNRNVVHLDYDAITMGIFHRRVHVPRTRRGDIIRKNGKKSRSGRSYSQLFANS